MRLGVAEVDQKYVAQYGSSALSVLKHVRSRQGQSAKGVIPTKLPRRRTVAERIVEVQTPGGRLQRLVLIAAAAIAVVAYVRTRHPDITGQGRS